MSFAASIARGDREGTVIAAKAVAVAKAAPRRTVAVAIWDGFIEPDGLSK
jgi:hypothetical protein